jgi:hypothetical protein
MLATNLKSEWEISARREAVSCCLNARVESELNMHAESALRGKSG